MRISETSHPIGFCGAKITLFAPRRVFSSRFSAPSAPRCRNIPFAQSKTPRFGTKAPRIQQKYPYFSHPLGALRNIILRARSYIIEISSTGEPYFLVNSFAFSIFFVFLPKDMSLHRTTNGRKSCFRTGKRQKAKPLHNLPSAQKTRRRP